MDYYDDSFDGFNSGIEDNWAGSPSHNYFDEERQSDEYDFRSQNPKKYQLEFETQNTWPHHRQDFAKDKLARSKLKSPFFSTKIEIQGTRLAHSDAIRFDGHDFMVNDLEVCFPFSPYPDQIKYISSVVNALDKRQNCLIESPTGTGKTLCLLTACLAWLTNRRNSIFG